MAIKSRPTFPILPSPLSVEGKRRRCLTSAVFRNGSGERSDSRSDSISLGLDEEYAAQAFEPSCNCAAVHTPHRARTSAQPIEIFSIRKNVGWWRGLGVQRTSQPRSGERSVAHGVSHGTRKLTRTSPGRGGTPVNFISSFAALRLLRGPQPIPTADAVGHRSFAAPQL